MVAWSRQADAPANVKQQGTARQGDKLCRLGFRYHKQDPETVVDMSNLSSCNNNLLGSITSVQGPGLFATCVMLKTYCMQGTPEQPKPSVPQLA